MKKIAWTIVGICLYVSISEGKASSNTLIDAYKKEFAFLEAEKSALKKRLEEVKKESASQIASAENELEKLQQQIMGARARADGLEADLSEVAKSTVSSEEKKDLLLETIERGFETLEKHGSTTSNYVRSENAAEQSEQLETLFALAGGVIEKAGSVEKTTGEFFDASGTLRKGDIIKLGKVAAYGIAGDKVGALAPAGAGKLRIWQQNAKESAESILKEKPLFVLSMFLFESLEKGIEEKKAKTPVEVIESGGMIAWVIVALGLLGLMMVFVRIFILTAAGRSAGKIVEKLKPAVREGNILKALEICKRSHGSAARVLKSVIQNLDRSREHLEDIVSEAVLHEVPHIERFGSTITVIAAVAPLLGLLGTVTGMISTFDVITEFGTGDPKMLSGGISEALVTTELGLITAIPMLLIGTLLSGRASGLVQTLERSALEIMNMAEQPEYKAKWTRKSDKASSIGQETAKEVPQTENEQNNTSAEAAQQSGEKPEKSEHKKPSRPLTEAPT